MTIYRHKKDGKLYLIYFHKGVRCLCTGKYVAVPYTMKSAYDAGNFDIHVKGQGILSSIKFEDFEVVSAA